MKKNSLVIALLVLFMSIVLHNTSSFSSHHVTQYNCVATLGEYMPVIEAY